MSVERVETLIIGGGQAGLAMSEQLSKHGLPHLVVERHRVAERWRSERWDGLRANGPAWHDRLPGLPIEGVDPDAFATRDQMVAYLSAYAEAIAAPVRCGVAVTSLQRRAEGGAFVAHTSHGVIEAANVVAATGPFQRPSIPAIVPVEADVVQLHASAYRNPGRLPEGAVLVVGAGASGAQIADELMRAGRHVYLSVGSHVRPPRRYRGRDFMWWVVALGIFDVAATTPTPRHVPQALSGAHGGETVDFRRMAARGLVLLGRAEAFGGGRLHVGADLAGTLARGDDNYISVLDSADAYVREHGLDLPEEPEARHILPDPPCVTDPVRSLDLRAAGIGAIVWATGYTQDFGWLDVPVFDTQGAPQHRRGVSTAEGLYFLGLSWLSRRASAFIFGVAQDAAYLAEHIRARSGAGGDR